MSVEPGNVRTDPKPAARLAARSQRFTSRAWARWLVGCILFLIFTGVILTLVVTLAAVLGLTPGS
jgi:hypothetical protein